MSYGTWNVFTIDGIEPDDPELWAFAEEWSLDVDSTLDHVTLSGLTKYGVEFDDGGKAAILSLSKRARVEHYIEYEYDETGKERNIYEGGEFVRGYHDAMVPDELPQLIDDARAALKGHDKAIATALEPSNPFKLADALRALVLALDPKDGTE